MNAPQYTEDNLRITITSPFGPDKLLFKSLQGEEALSQPFRFTVEMLSQADIALSPRNLDKFILK